ncbi:MAG: hypothetical protein JXD19_04060 [Deltaproteobacteria bacterium]|nr:hypothetical protein [Deltaproteobacteria bacterium]
MRKKINALLLIGIIGSVVCGSHFAVTYGRALWGPSDIWWTPISMALPLDETTQEFNILVSNELLQDHLKRRSLTATDLEGKSYQVVSDDIEVRLNNWHKVKASFLHSAVFAAFMLGVSITCLILGAVQVLTRRDGRKETGELL